MSELPWYHEGLKFKCTGCGECCTGEAGYIWVNQTEIRAIAEAMGLSPVEFEERFVEPYGLRRSLKERPGGDCVLLDAKTKRCSVYDVRPRQCRSWPFWASNLKTPESWEETCQVCPGAGVGTKVPFDQIERNRGMIRI